MVDITKLDMTDIWASSGDKTAPDPSKIATGWIVEAVPRQWWNWFENRQDQNIAYMLQKGIPEWDQFTEYLTNKSYVQRNNVVYKCIQTGTNQDPATAPLYWVKAFPESSAALEAVRVLTPAADRVAFYTGADTADLMTVTAFSRTLLDDPNVTTWRATLGAAASHPSLTALASVTGANNLIPYFTASSAMAVTSFTAFARTLMDDADAATARATLGVDSAATAAAALAAGLATKQDLDATLTALAGTTTANNTINYWTGVDTTTTTPLTVFARTLLDDADAATMRTTLSVTSAADTAANLTAGLATKQDLDATLTALAGLATGINQLPYSTGTDTFAQTSFTAFARTLLDDADAVTMRNTIGAHDAANLTTGFIDLARIPATLTGKNASTATALETPRTIQGVSFNGTANITLSVVDKDSATGSAILPAGTTAQRSASPVNGQIRYNSDNNEFEGYINGAWGGIGGGTPLYTVLWWPSRASIPAGYLPADGQLLTRTTYQAAFAGVLAGLLPEATDAAWLASGTYRACYTQGNGTTTFRIPDLNGKSAGNAGAPFLRGDGTSSSGTTGLIQSDALQNVTGSMTFHGALAGTGSTVLGNASGALQPSDIQTKYEGVSNPVAGANSYGSVNFAFSNAPGARTSTETRPVNATGVYIIKLIGGASDLSQEDASVAVAALETRVSTLSGGNRIINGAANIVQRGNVAFSTGQVGYGGPDRFRAVNGASAGGVFTQSVTNFTHGGFSKGAVQQTVNTAVASISGGNYWQGIHQLIEGTNCYDMVGVPMALSFVFLSNISGTFSVSVRDGTTAQSYISSFVAVAGAPLKVEILIPANSSLTIQRTNVAGLTVSIGAINTGTFQTASLNTWQAGNYLSASGATNWGATIGNYIAVTDLQLEVGVAVTPMERRANAIERLLCQRYYEVVGGTLTVNKGNYVINTYKVPKRATPTITLSSGSLAGADFDNYGGSVDIFRLPANLLPSGTSDYNMAINAEL